MLDAPVKERLTGAIILVAVLVLLVPELLTGPSRSVKTDGAAASGEVSTGADGAQMRSYTINLADGGAAHGASGAPVTETSSSEAKPAETPQASAPDAHASGSAGGGDAKSTGAPEIKSTPQAMKPGTSQVESAEKALPPSDTSAESEKAPASAPRPVRSAAPAQREPPPTARVESPPAPRASSTPLPRAAAESHSGAGWAIQVGSFASRENAERLARELKGKGFAATVSQYSKGKRLWRVRVGPEPDRAAAVALGARLRSAGHTGSPVPYP